MLKMIHSLWAYVALIVLILAVVNAITGLTSKREFKAKDLRISLFSLIAIHIQLLIGLFAYYKSSFYEVMREVGMGEVMKNSELRKLLVEHPLAILIAITLITIGFSAHKKKSTDKAKFKTLAIYFTIALILILGVIPWNLWFTN